MAHGIQQADVCIICALEEEANAVEQEISEHCQTAFAAGTTDDGRFVYRYTTIANNKHEQIILLLFCQTRPGPVFIALDLRSLLELFQPRFVAMSGICAGDKRHLHLGDLVVAEYAYHFEEGKTTRDESGTLVHQPEGITYGLAEHILRYVRTFGAWEAPVRKLKKRFFNSDEPPRRVMALMASGMAVRSDDPFESLQSQHRKTWALDMEAATFYLALRAFPGMGGLVVKGVVDYADLSKDDTFHDFAAHASAVYLLTFIQEYVTADMPLPHFPRSASSSRGNEHGLMPRSRPKEYLPIRSHMFFYPRPYEFERLEELLFRSTSKQVPFSPARVAIIGMGGIGKSQLAVELANRYRGRFPDGIFWTGAMGESDFEWQQHLAKLAVHTDYFPPDDDISNPEHQERRARHICRYIAEHRESLLILDNVNAPYSVLSALTNLAGTELRCTIVYTSRHKIVPDDFVAYTIEILPEEIALRLLLEGQRSLLLSSILANKPEDVETKAARRACQMVGYLPLAIVHLRGVLSFRRNLTLVQLVKLLQERGTLAVAQRSILDFSERTLDATFRLSWEMVNDDLERHMFKLLGYFPEAALIPRWLIKCALNPREEYDKFGPLEDALLFLQMVNLVEEFSTSQVRLHPLVREFAQQLVVGDEDGGKGLVEETARRLANEFDDIEKLEQRAVRNSYWECFDQVRAVREYVQLLGSTQIERLERIERYLDRESYLLGSDKWWPDKIVGLFYQQLYNRFVEDGRLPRNSTGIIAALWLRQMKPIEAEDRTLLRVLAGSRDELRRAVFSPDKRMLASCGREGRVQLWDVTNGKLLRTLRAHESGIESVEFSPDGTMLATGAYDRTARLWDVASGRLLKILEGHLEGVWSVAFSPDGIMLATGSGDRMVRLWDIASGTVVKILESDQTAVLSVKFSPDGTRLAVGTKNRATYIWDVINGSLLKTLNGHRGWVWSVAFSPDGAKIATASDRVIRLWDSKDGQLLKELRGHWHLVQSVAFSPDGVKIASGAFDQRVCLWDAVGGRMLGILEGHHDHVNEVAFSPDGANLASASADQTVRIWNVRNLQSQKLADQHSGLILSVALSADKKRILSSSVDRTIHIWDVENGALLRVLRSHHGSVQSAVFSPDNTKVISSSTDCTVRLWDAESGILLKTLEGHQDAVRSVVFSPDGTMIASGSEDLTVRIWNAENGVLLKTLEGHQDAVKSVVFSPDGTMIASGSEDRTVRLWDAVRGTLIRTLEGHQGSILSMTFSSDGAKLATGGSHGRRVYIWDLRNGEVLAELKGHSSWIRRLVFSPDGRFLVSSDTNGQVFFWQMGTENKGQLLDLYMATYEIGAIYWEGQGTITLVDLGGAGFRPHIYQLKLEGDAYTE